MAKRRSWYKVPMESLRAQDYPLLHLEHVLFRIKPRSKHPICRQISAGTETLGEHLVRIQESLSGTEQRQRSKSAWIHSDYLSIKKKIHQALHPVASRLLKYFKAT